MVQASGTSGALLGSCWTGRFLRGSEEQAAVDIAMSASHIAWRERR